MTTVNGMTTPSYLRLSAALAIVDRETPGLDAYDRAALAYDLRDLALEAEAGYDPDEDGSDAYVRHLELQGYDEARLQEDMEARMGVGAW